MKIQHRSVEPRLLQLLAVTTMLLSPIGMLAAFMATLKIKSHKIRAALLSFILYTFFNKAHERRGRNNGWLRDLFTWNLCADYFPISLHKTVNLPRDKPYVFAYHPHGILGAGVVLGIATNALGIKQLLPGVNIHPATLDMNFRIPVFRDFLLSLGFISCESTALDAVLSNNESVMLAVGGAAEAMDSRPGTNFLTLDTRLGFIRLALRHGASLVPVFGFGETDIFSQTENREGSFLRRFQELFKDWFTFSPVFFYGRFGVVIPYRRPVAVVIGKPIHVPKLLDPSDLQVRKWHSVYVKALKELYNAHKDELLPHRTSDLVIVDQIAVPKL
ncbi:diacylglycerol O-acyltransferase 2 [Obelidium mucronatum]|nr:diacylglycerol O-acyltransferase 2 [Obelidium mucronatum]